MNNEETKQLCLDLLKAQDAEEVVTLLKKKRLWDDESKWRDYGDNPAAFATVNNQGDPLFALTEKITNSIDAVLMGKCFENGIDPKNYDMAPKSLFEAIHEFIEKDSNTSFKFKKLFDEFVNNKKYKDKTIGNQLYWDNSFTLKIAENIAITATGNHDGHPNIAISDLGEGQTPENLPETILSLHKGNKEKVPFSQGKWNQGGSGAILHCGQDSEHQVSLIVTRRNPKIINKFNQFKTPLHDHWSFSVIKRLKPGRENPNGMSRVVYLAPVKFQNDDTKYPLHFSSETFPIFPKWEDGDERPFSKEAPYGTCVMLYEYNIPKSHVGMSNGIYRRIELQMPKLPLPIRLWETRTTRSSSDKAQAYSIKGFCNVHDLDVFENENKRKLEEIHPNEDYLTVDEYQISYKIYCFKKNQSQNYIEKNAGILWTVNGQTHAIQQNTVFNNEKLAFKKIRKDLLIVIDCTNITGSDREDVFKSSRDRLDNDNKIVQEIKSRLIDQLADHEGLKKIVSDRISETAKEDNLEDDAALMNDISKLLSDLEEKDKDFMPEGLTFKIKKETEAGSGDKSFNKKEFPTFFEFKSLKGKENQILNKDFEIGSKLNISLITDAFDNYFTRRNKRGTFKITQILEGEEINLKSFSGPSLIDGSCSISNIILKKKFEVGELIQLKIQISDDYENTNGFLLYMNCSVRPKQQKLSDQNKKSKNGNNKKNIMQSGTQGLSTKETPSQKPIIAIPLTKEEWESTTDEAWNEELVTYVEKQPIKDQDGKYHYQLYYNKDNINLIREFRKATHSNPESLIEKKYMLTISLVATYALIQFRKDRENNLLDKIEIDDSDPLTIEEETHIKIATKAISRGAFQLPDFISKYGD